MSMFRTAQKLRGAITLFHDPAIAPSAKIFQRLETAYPDPTQRSFDIQVTEERPTATQFSTISEFNPSINEKTFKAPLLVDWFNGRTADSESTAEKILKELN